ncbi:MAG: hypothetical protein JNL38_00320, partial [Myxococcales bacterium]|nr:hypothetical protein [Myxococcales bacterium]
SGAQRDTGPPGAELGNACDLHRLLGKAVDARTYASVAKAQNDDTNVLRFEAKALARSVYEEHETLAEHVCLGFGRWPLGWYALLVALYYLLLVALFWRRPPGWFPSPQLAKAADEAGSRAASLEKLELVRKLPVWPSATLARRQVLQDLREVTANAQRAIKVANAYWRFPHVLLFALAVLLPGASALGMEVRPKDGGYFWELSDKEETEPDLRTCALHTFHALGWIIATGLVYAISLRFR